MDTLHVFLLGKFHLQLGEQILTTLNTTKLQELFSYLLLYQERPLFRETLANLLWNENITTQPQRCLRKTLWYLRDALDAQTDHLSDTLFIIEPEWIQINPEADLWIDAVVFEEAFASIRDIPGKDIDDQRILNLQSAIELYKGDLLEGIYQDWCIYERERLQDMYLTMLGKLMDYYEAHHNYKAGIMCGAHILHYDQAHERTHRKLMRLFYLDDDRTAALRQYQHCVEALNKELGVKPTRRTRMLYQQIQGDQFTEPVQVQTAKDKESEGIASSLPEVLQRLQQLQTTLAQLQNQVYQEIQVVNTYITDQC